MAKITETTPGRTFSLEVTEGELAAIGELLGVYGHTMSEVVTGAMRGHVLNQSRALALRGEILLALRGSA